MPGQEPDLLRQRMAEIMLPVVQTLVQRFPLLWLTRRAELDGVRRGEAQAMRPPQRRMMNELLPPPRHRLRAEQVAHVERLEAAHAEFRG